MYSSTADDICFSATKTVQSEKIHSTLWEYVYRSSVYVNSNVLYTRCTYYTDSFIVSAQNLKGKRAFYVIVWQSNFTRSKLSLLYHGITVLTSELRSLQDNSEDCNLRKINVKGHTNIESAKIGICVQVYLWSLTIQYKSDRWRPTMSSTTSWTVKMYSCQSCLSEHISVYSNGWWVLVWLWLYLPVLVVITVDADLVEKCHHWQSFCGKRICNDRDSLEKNLFLQPMPVFCKESASLCLYSEQSW